MWLSISIYESLIQKTLNFKAKVWGEVFLSCLKTKLYNRCLPNHRDNSSSIQLPTQHFLLCVYDQLHWDPQQGVYSSNQICFTSFHKQVDSITFLSCPDFSYTQHSPNSPAFDFSPEKIISQWSHKCLFDGSTVSTHCAILLNPFNPRGLWL